MNFCLGYVVMHGMRTSVALLCTAIVATGCAISAHSLGQTKTPHHAYKVVHTDAEWLKLLPHDSFVVLRHAGTEAPFTGKYWNNHQVGTYVCLGCGQELFKSDTKFESGTGWPSFWAPIKKDAVDVSEDDSLGMVRNEVTCSRCGGHLGHVFDDGPQPTGLRYCMNSASLKFIPLKPVK